jgi:hypothetical protein
VIEASNVQGLDPKPPAVYSPKEIAMNIAPPPGEALCPNCQDQGCDYCGPYEQEPKMAQATYVSVWDGGITLRSRATVNVKKRTVTIHECHDVDVEVLEEEYVELGDKDFPATNEQNRKDYSLEEQAKMFFYE